MAEQQRPLWDFADQSARILTLDLRAGRPFLFLRYGDGALFALNRWDPGSTTCDGEPLTAELGADLSDSIETVAGLHPSAIVYVGDWRTASFVEGEPEYELEYRQVLGRFSRRSIRLVHFEALLLMRQTEPLRKFYMAVRHDLRKKLVLGPEWFAEPARLLGAEHLMTPMQGLHARAWFYEHALLQSDAQVILFGAGLAGMLPIVRCWEKFPNRTYIHVGSAFDPLRRPSRSQQIPTLEARSYFRGVLCD